jgi:hypothetical protein
MATCVSIRPLHYDFCSPPLRTLHPVCLGYTRGILHQHQFCNVEVINRLITLINLSCARSFEPNHLLALPLPRPLYAGYRHFDFAELISFGRPLRMRIRSLYHGNVTYKAMVMRSEKQEIACALVLADLLQCKSTRLVVTLYRCSSGIRSCRDSWGAIWAMGYV